MLGLHSGTWIGALTGLVSALLTYLYLYDLLKPPNPHPSWWERTFGRKGVSGAKTASLVATKALFWVESPWLVSNFMSSINWKTEMDYYIEGLAIFYGVPVLIAIARLMIYFWNKMGS